MKALRILLIVLGCSCIAFNIAQIASSDSSPLPVDAGLFRILEIYVSKLYLLFAGILLLAFGSNVNYKVKTKQVA